MSEGGSPPGAQHFSSSTIDEMMKDQDDQAAGSGNASDPSSASMPADLSGLSQMAQGGAGGAGGVGHGGPAGAHHNATSPDSGRSIGSPLTEAKYMIQDVARGLLSLPPKIVMDALRVGPKDSAEVAQIKRETLKNYQEQEAELAEYRQKKKQEETEMERQEAELEAEKKRRQEAAQSQDLLMPTGRQDGAGAQGVVKQMNQKRQQMTSAD